MSRTAAFCASQSGGGASQFQCAMTRKGWRTASSASRLRMPSIHAFDEGSVNGP